MQTFIIIMVIAIAAFMVAWVANGLVGLLSGEHPRDTGKLWLETFLKIFVVLELGWVGRALNRIGLSGLAPKVFFFIGLLFVLAFLAKSCEPERHDGIQIYPAHKR